MSPGATEPPLLKLGAPASCRRVRAVAPSTPAGCQRSQWKGPTFVYANPAMSGSRESHASLELLEELQFQLPCELALCYWFLRERVDDTC